MKHQYVGDISDYRKYALLRALSANGTNRIGICWMLTPDDRRSDGNKLGYLTRPDEFRACDPELFDLLSSAAAAPDRRRLSQIEESGIVPSAVYVNDTLPDDLAGRLMFMKQARQMVVNTDLVFFDPDNGMETSLPKGRKNSNKFVYMDELAAFYETGKSLLVYQHFPRVERAAFISSCAERIENAAPRAAIWAFTTSHVVFLLAVHPDSPARLAIAAMLACGRWEPEFMLRRLVDGGHAGTTASVSALLNLPTNTRTHLPEHCGWTIGTMATSLTGTSTVARRLYTTKQMGDACEMVVAAELTLAGVPALKVPDNWPGYDVIAQPLDRPPQRVSVKSRTFKHGASYVTYYATDQFDWLAIVLLGIGARAGRAIYLVPRDVADHRARRDKPTSKTADERYFRVDQVDDLFGTYHGNFGLQHLFGDMAPISVA